jgi:hypothetical protein
MKSLLIKLCLFSLLLMPTLQTMAQTDPSDDAANPQAQAINAEVTTEADSGNDAGDPAVVAESDANNADENVVSDASDVPGRTNLKASGIGSGSKLMYLSASPAKPTIKKGDTVSIKITGTTTNGKTRDYTKLCKWSTGNKSVATVAGGKIKGISTGSTNVYATFGGKKAGVYVTVTSDSAKNELLRINAQPETVSLKRGATKSVRIIATYGNGSTKDVTSSCTWESTRAFVATVSRGTIKGIKAGVATVKAHFGGKTADVVVTVK